MLTLPFCNCHAKLPRIFRRLDIIHPYVEIGLGPMVSQMILNVKEGKSPAHSIATMKHNTGFIKLFLLYGVDNIGNLVKAILKQS